MIDRDWKERRIKDPSFVAKEPIAKEARLARCLIYSVATRIWYTPQEFLDSGERVDIYRGKQSTKQFCIIDPAAGLRYKEEELKKIRMEHDRLKGKIEDYLSNRLK